MLRGNAECVILQHQSYEPIAQVVLDGIAIEERGDRFVVDLSDDRADLIVGGDSAFEALTAAAESLGWYAEYAMRQGKDFPQFEGVSFKQMREPLGSDRNLEFFVSGPSQAKLLTA